MESWKLIYYEGKNTGVLVSNKGKLSKHGIPAKLYDSGSGYLTFGLCSGITKSGKTTTIRKYLHRVVAEAFVENPFNLPQVNHKDGNKQNNAADNLEWVTKSDNIRHMHSLGLTSRGKITKVELTDSEVQNCYLRAKHYGESITDIALSMAKPRTTISSIVNKRSRKSFTDSLDLLMQDGFCVILHSS